MTLGLTQARISLWSDGILVLASSSLETENAQNWLFSRF